MKLNVGYESRHEQKMRVVEIMMLRSLWKHKSIREKVKIESIEEKLGETSKMVWAYT